MWAQRGAWGLPLRGLALSACLLSGATLRAAPRSYELKELKEQGYITEEEAPTFGAFSHTLTALGPGALIHGVGHWRMGDQVGGWRLLGAELAGLVALAGVSLTQRYSSNSSALSQAGLSTLSHYGWGLVLGSWVADIVGSYQGGLTYPPERGATRGAKLSLGYRYLEDPSASLTHHLISAATIERARFKISGSLNVESRARLVGAELSAEALLLGARHQEGFRASLGARARRWRWLDDDLTQLAALPYIRWSLPLGRVARGLSHSEAFQRLSYGLEAFQSPRSEALSRGASPDELSLFDRVSAPLAHQRTLLVIETGLRLKLSPQTSLALSYLEDPTLDVPARTWGSALWGVEALGLAHNEGIWRGEFVIRQSAQIDFIAEFMMGARWSSWLTVRYALGARDRS